jgi:facilitated trehalose transporter
MFWSLQMAAACAASLSFMVMGMVRGWSSPGMPSLIQSKEVEMTDEDVSWISKLFPSF